ncbi:hypothetical protein NEUTE1DRAFT_139196 [Neurospora tetrasperma FGSC 2508]|uniref:Uncharacterized protein n=1 Tax=Neurospora tetrasperma (strain FGSC 2508 / ATCC MYA-4615 / P0657) TaxID=510951 RepID=F8MPK0_NEUT8|nr:uncharacterized protein NEUTE1DRAFT_139196 [Neurospora tetrasperma FGSC 2508]EGO57159.1 hypothetical protein NEUTE1DRAFT_139196 [Neurospora tetrasperma FGSC 2508]EGZ69920.1 hypothetical protein NEUTE2DRAFT_139556 [Neurospora tetrasperma FGSC 2509]
MASTTAMTKHWLEHDAIPIPAPRYSPRTDADGKPIFAPTESKKPSTADFLRPPRDDEGNLVTLPLLAALRARKAARAAASAASPKKKTKTKTVGPKKNDPRPVFFSGCMPGSQPGRVLWLQGLDYFAASRAELKAGKKGGSGNGRSRPPKHVREQNAHKEEALAEKQCKFIEKSCPGVKYGEDKEWKRREKEEKERVGREAIVRRIKEQIEKGVRY